MEDSSDLQATKDQTVKWLQRDHGFSKEQAQQELKFLFSKGLDDLLKNDGEGYIQTSRAGATKALNRKARRAIVSSVQNAYNHVTAVSRG